jgi:hypothetical protein
MPFERAAHSNDSPVRMTSTFERILFHVKQEICFISETASAKSAIVGASTFLSTTTCAIVGTSTFLSTTTRAIVGTSTFRAIVGTSTFRAIVGASTLSFERRRFQVVETMTVRAQCS